MRQPRARWWEQGAAVPWLLALRVWDDGQQTPCLDVGRGCLLDATPSICPRPGCFFAALSTWLELAHRWGSGKGPQTRLGGLTQGKASSPSCATALAGPQPGGEMGIGLCLRDLTLPASRGRCQALGTEIP